MVAARSLSWTVLFGVPVPVGPVLGHVATSGVLNDHSYCCLRERDQWNADQGPPGTDPGGDIEVSLILSFSWPPLLPQLALF